MPQIDSHLTAKLYVDNAISDGVSESSLLRLDPDEKLKQDTIILNSTLSAPKMIIELPTKNYVNKKFDDPSMIKNTDHVDFNDKYLDNIKWIKLNNMPEWKNDLTPKLYVDNAIRGIRGYVDNLHQINRNRRDLSSVFNDQDNEFDNNKLTNLDSVTVNRNPNLEYELANKKCIDDELDRNTVLGFNQTLQNYLKVSVGDDVYNLTKYNKIQITDTAEMRYPNIGSDLLQKWNIKCNNKNNQSRITDFIKSTRRHSPTGYSRATSFPPIGNSFMYIETNSNNHGHERVFVSFERTDIIQISNIIFYYNRFSILTNNSKKSMGRFRIQLLLEDNTWSIRYNIPKNGPYSNSSTQWTLVNLNFTVENYGIRLVYDQISIPHNDMCFSNFTITHSVY